MNVPARVLALLLVLLPHLCWATGTNNCNLPGSTCTSSQFTVTRTPASYPDAGVYTVGLNMAGNRLSNMAAGILPGDAVTIQQFESATGGSTSGDVNITELQGQVPSSMNPLPAQLTDGTSYYKATTPSDLQPVALKLADGGTGALPVNGSGFTQPVSGTVAVSNFPATQPVSGEVSALLKLSDGGVSALPVNGSGVTQPISAVALPLPLGASTETSLAALLALYTARQPVLGQAAMVASSPVVIASNQSAIPISGSVTATVSGVLDVNIHLADGGISALPVDSSGVTQPISAVSLPLPALAANQTKQDTGNTSLASIDTKTPALASGRVPVDPSGVTSPISVASLPLPSGASTSAKQPALGTAGTPSADVLTVQGATSMTALKVDGSGSTQPVSGTIAATQSGTWTVQPGNTANTTAWKVDGSAVTQPVSGTVTANVGTTNGLALDTTLAKLTVTQGAALGANTQALAGASVTTAAPSYTTGQISPLSITTAGGLRTDSSGTTQPVSGTIAATQSGTWNVTNVSGTVSLPTGASTETSLAKLTIAQNATLGSNTAILDGASVTTAEPTYTTGRIQPLSLGTNGNVRAQIQGVQADSAVYSSTTNKPVVVGTYNSAGNVAIMLSDAAENLFIAPGVNARALLTAGTLTLGSTTYTSTQVGTGPMDIQIAARSAPTGTNPTLTATVVDTDPSNSATSVGPTDTSTVLTAASSTFLHHVCKTGQILLTVTIGGTSSPQFTNVDLNMGLVATHAVQALPLANGVAPTTLSANQTATLGMDTQRRLLTRNDCVNPFSCMIDGATAASTLCKAAPAAGLQYYVTDVYINTATAQTVKLVYGTGATCGSGTTTISSLLGQAAGSTLDHTFATPYPTTTINAICVTSSGVGAYNATLSGCIAP